MVLSNNGNYAYCYGPYSLVTLDISDETAPVKLDTLERDVTSLENIIPPFPRITYDEASKILNENGSESIDQIRIQDCIGDGYKGTGSAVLNSVVDGIAIYNTVNTIFVTNTSMIRLKRSFYTDRNWDGNVL